MADIRGDHAEMARLGTRLADELYREYNDEIEQIFEEIETLKSKWVGIDQAGFIQNITSKKPALQNLGKIVNGYGAFLVDSSNHLKKVQDEIADATTGL